MKDETCIFCKIISKEIPAEIVYETETSLAFLDINPVHEGHTLLVPKGHSSNMLETNEAVIGALIQETKRLMISIKKATNADFVVLTVVGTDVPHFHIHLIPRFHNDGLAGFWPAQKYASDERKKEVAEGIRTELTTIH